jgi:hypothetical protein
MSDWVAFGSAVVGGAVAASAALGGVALGQRGENRRAVKVDQQRLRDAKAERLRVLYKPFVEFAMLLRQVTSEKSYVLEGDTVEERDARHQKQFSEGMRQVSAVVATAIIEPGTAEVRKAYEATYTACDRYLRSLNMNARVHGTTSLDELNKQFEAIATAGDALEAAAVHQLEELEKPI